ncbi:hypothetical protein OHB26_38805 (plasmid) [Nocardia sp. NBC_01503]|uniref:hypothetical protein n=1 Tax=Nocardia sp. NBC_01503 TaxID=2975997 RepID=UPI002E7C1372|nr:hypothetical protein [Nocardia sp. NBC_01503]WTL36629.1 hypothetical protein OHB26_38805 [Nocardia sp. NBC_01503]
MTRHLTRGGRVLAVAATLLIAVGCGGHDDHTSTATTSAPPPDPARPPALVRWEPWQGVRLPISSVDGPARTSTDAAAGYSHTPQGAALAAIQNTVRISIAPDNSWALVAHTLLGDGPGKDDFVLNRVQYSITGPAAPDYTPTLRGYTITRYGADRSEITVYSSYPDNSLMANATVMAWQYGDWRLILPDPAGKTTVVSAIADLPADLVRLEPPR